MPIPFLLRSQNTLRKISARVRRISVFYWEGETKFGMNIWSVSIKIIQQVSSSKTWKNYLFPWEKDVQFYSWPYFCGISNAITKNLAASVNSLFVIKQCEFLNDNCSWLTHDIEKWEISGNHTSSIKSWNIQKFCHQYKRAGKKILCVLKPFIFVAM